MQVIKSPAFGREVFNSQFNGIVRNWPGKLEGICIPDHRNLDSFQGSLLNDIEYRERVTKNGIPQNIY